MSRHTKNQDFTVTGQEAATNTVSGDAPNANRGQRQYSVSGLDNATTYDIALFDAADVTVADNGTVSFEDDPNNNVADLTVDTTGGVIEVVNGSTNADGDNHVETSPVNGTISFSVDSTTSDSVVPVIWVDGEPVTDGDDLDLDANNQPTETFGIGGQKTWVPAEADSGLVGADSTDANDVDIVDVDKAANQIFSATDLYIYDANDNFFISDVEDGSTVGEGDRVTMAEFEAQLSAGDQLDGYTFYQANEELPSRFVLEDNAPGAPAVTAAEDGEDSNEVTVDVTGLGLDADDTITVIQTASSADAATATPADCTDDTYAAADAAEVGTFTLADDEDSTTGGVQLTIAADPDGAVNGCYLYQSYVTVDGEQSEESDATPAAANTAQSVADTTDPDMTGASANDINNGVGSTNQVIVTFSEPVTAVDAALITVSPSTQPGLEIAVTSAAQRNATGTTWTLTLGQSLDDATVDVTYNISTEEGAYTDAAGNENPGAAVDTTFAY